MNRSFRLLFGSLILVACGICPGCGTLPTPKVIRYRFPKDVYVQAPDRPYEKLGVVRTKVNFLSLDPGHEELDLCHNYYNKAAADLLQMARKEGADAVVDIRSVVFLIDGRMETHKTPECSDDGEEGQILAEGVAVKWKPERNLPVGKVEIEDIPVGEKENVGKNLPPSPVPSPFSSPVPSPIPSPIPTPISSPMPALAPSLAPVKRRPSAPHLQPTRPISPAAVPVIR